MSRISKTAFALLLIALLGITCLAEDTLIPQEDIVASVANYTKTRVTIGSYETTQQLGAQVSYPLSYTIRYSGETVKYNESFIKRNGEVKQGDPIMSFVSEVDEVAVYETELAITRAKEDRSYTLSVYEEDIAKLTEDGAKEYNTYKKDNINIQIRIKELEKQKYIASSDRELAELEEKLAYLLEQGGIHYVYAPCDGVISEVSYFRDRETVLDGTVLAVMYDPNVILLSADSASLRYGMHVNVTMGSNTDRLKLNGTVVASDSLIAGQSISNSVLISLEGYTDRAPENLTRPSLQFSPVYLGNILAVEPKAVGIEGGKYFVYKLSADGMLSKRFINYVTAPSGGKGWILRGAEAGETVVIY